MNPQRGELPDQTPVERWLRVEVDRVLRAVCSAGTQRGRRRLPRVRCSDLDLEQVGEERV